MSILSALAAPVLRWLYPDPMLAGTAAGGASEVMGAREMYDPRNALSAMDAFPWVRTCVEVVSTDLSGLPLQMVRMDPASGEREILRGRDARLLDLFDTAMRVQLYTDFVLTGEAYLRIVGNPLVDGYIHRIHPADIEPQVDPDTGRIVEFKWGRWSLQPQEVLYVKNANWERGVRSARGTSPIRALEQGLKASQAARKYAMKTAENGRLEMLFKPADAIAQFGKSGVEAIKNMFLEAKRDGSGAMVLNRAIDAVPLTLSSREMEFSELDSKVMHETLSVFGVPPVRAGLPGANYGTARQQNRDAWERRKHQARLFDDVWSRLTGDRDVRIEHDLRDVEALQNTRSERLGRVLQHVSNGISVLEAYKFEGFDDVPASEDTEPINMRPPQTPGAAAPDEPQEDNGEGRALMRAIGRWQEGAAVRYQYRMNAGDMARDWAIEEADLLAHHLEAAGVESATARAIATHGAKLAHSAVSTIVDTQSVDGVVGIRTLRCFGPDFRRMITKSLRAA